MAGNQGLCTVDDCDQPIVPYGWTRGMPRGARGYCRYHYVRFNRYGDPVTSPLEVTRRFWSKVDRVADTEICWRWLGSGDKWGYGRFYIDGSRGIKQRVQAHRFAYENVRGPIPDGLTLDHLCYTPSCVNPWHLEPVTRGENAHRAAVRNAPTHCAQGHPYNEANTAYRATGFRRCKECYRIRARQYAQRKKEAARA